VRNFFIKLVSKVEAGGFGGEKSWGGGFYPPRGGGLTRGVGFGKKVFRDTFFAGAAGEAWRESAALERREERGEKIRLLNGGD